MGCTCEIAVSLLPPDQRTFWNPQDVWDYPDFIRRLKLNESAFVPDLIHCWSPRGMILEFVSQILDLYPNIPIIVHFEDPEFFLFEATSTESRKNWSDPNISSVFLSLVQGVTTIIPALGSFMPGNLDSFQLFPGIHGDTIGTDPLPLRVEKELNKVGSTELIMGYFGNTHEFNSGEVFDLYQAIDIACKMGRKIRLIRTGKDSGDFIRLVSSLNLDWEIHLGWVPRNWLGTLIKKVDLVIQPGSPGIFNDHRLPSKLPELFFLGIPVVMGKTNLGSLINEEEFPGQLLDDMSPESLAEALLSFDKKRTAEWQMKGFAAHRKYFDTTRNVAGLLTFYQRHAQRINRGWGPFKSNTPPLLKIILTGLRQFPVEDPTYKLTLNALDEEMDRIRNYSMPSQLGENLPSRVELSNLLIKKQENLEYLLNLLVDHKAEQRELLQRLRAVALQLKSVEKDYRDREREIFQKYTNFHQRYEAELNWRRKVQKHPLFKALKPFIELPSVQITQSEQPILKSNQTELLVERRLLEIISSVHDERLNHPDDIRYLIDIPSNRIVLLDSPVCTVAGWFLDDQIRPAEWIEIRSATKSKRCQLNQPREEALEGLDYSSDSAKLCGFVGEIPIEEGLYEFGIWVKPYGSEPFELVRRTTAYFEDSKLPSSLTAERLYQQWVIAYDTIDESKMDLYSIVLNNLVEKPLISIVVPVFNTPEVLLEACIDSVLDQIYPHWELCIANDASTESHVASLLEKYVAKDQRIKVIHRSQNGHISRATNSALNLANGDYVGFLDHDDLLRPHTLLKFVETINSNPTGKLFYSDEDKVDLSGRRFDPFFKPEWNPDLFLSQNYISHFTLVEASVQKLAGELNPLRVGCQDWDLLMRVTEICSPEEIVHIPHILYHWRAISGSTAFDRGEKSYAIKAGIEALNDHLVRTKQFGEAVSPDGQYYRIQWSLPSDKPKVTVIIPTKDRLDLLRVIIDGLIEKTEYPNIEILVVDNGSSERQTINYLDLLKQQSIRVLDFPGEFNFSAINNFGVRKASGEVVGLLNNDLEVISKDWLMELVSQAMRPEVGVVGCKLLYPDERIQHAGVILGPGGGAGHAFKYLNRDVGVQMNRANLVQNFSAVTGACMFFRKSVWNQVGGLNDEDLKVAFNDVDFCLRVRRAGYRVVYTPFAELIHHESLSRGLEDDFEKQSRFGQELRYLQRSWAELIKGDPAYNPNLTIDREDFSLAFPPRVSGQETKIKSSL